TSSRTYNALVWGDFAEEEGTIEGHIGRSPKDRTVQQVFPDGEQGKPAVTHWRVLERFTYVTLVECRLETGRTHQIRAHMRWIGHPLFNDAAYGGDRVLKGTTFTKYRQFVENCFAACPRQALHARTLGFDHPRTRERLQFESPLPDDMNKVLERWRNYVSANPPEA
ncbi:MAG: RluA family pseudouridine synthase, partial [Flavobacteriales bacterium]|nr:RluA family pseudouridine synthase [Flavobacteriales bacterium]